MPRKKQAAGERSERNPYIVFHVHNPENDLGHPVVAYTSRQAAFLYLRDQLGAFPPGWQGQFSAKVIPWGAYRSWYEKHMQPKKKVKVEIPRYKVQLGLDFTNH